MTAAEKIAEARALIEETEGHDPGPYRIGGPTGAGRSIISGGKHVGSAMGKANTGLFLAAPDLRETVAALADLAEAQAQEIAVRDEALRAARDVIACWDWWIIDEYDRDRRPVVDSIEDLRIAMAGIGDTP